MHDMGHHADLEAAKIQMRQLLQQDSAAVRHEIRKKAREELLGRSILFVLALAATAIIWLQGPS